MFINCDLILNVAQVRLSSLYENSSKSLSEKFGNFSEDSLNLELAALQRETEALRKEKIEPLRSAILTLSRQLSGAIPLQPGNLLAEVVSKLKQIAGDCRAKEDR